MLTLIFVVVLESRNDFTMFQSIPNPEPALTMNMQFKVCNEAVKNIILLSNPWFIHNEIQLKYKN